MGRSTARGQAQNILARTSLCECNERTRRPGSLFRESYPGIASRCNSTLETRYPARSTSAMAAEMAACSESARRSNNNSIPSRCPRIDASVHPALPRASVASSVSSCVIGAAGTMTLNRKSRMIEFSRYCPGQRSTVRRVSRAWASAFRGVE